MDIKLKVAILIVSDTASQEPASDRIASALAPILAAEGKWEPPEIRIVPDNVFQIQQAVCEWSDDLNWVNLILLSGGTGFAVKDHTPEAVSPLIHRPAPGLIHGMIAASLEITPFAMMSRPVAGVRHKTLVITLPGSPKGARENLEAIVKLLPHACLQSAGANSRSIHAGGVKSLEVEAGIDTSRPNQLCCHQHGHGHVPPKAHTSTDRLLSNDPSAGPNHRYRSSPYRMLSVEEALLQIGQHTPEPAVVEAFVNPSIVGSVVAEDVFALEAVPAYKASIVDGYAVIAQDLTNDASSTKGVFLVTSITHANSGGSVKPLQPGTVARITTGAPLPPNANAVVMVEDTELISSTADGTEEETIEILTRDIKPGENVREPGSDVQIGSKILTRGDLISSVGAELGLLASTGNRIVKVFKKPRVGVLSTGDELVEYDDPCTLTGGQIRDSNRPSLLSCLSSWGFQTVDLGIARDTPPDELANALHDSLRGIGRASPGIDVIVTTGGVSMGELDLLKPTIERRLGGTIHFGRVSMKPGKPTTFATIPTKAMSDGNSQEGPKKVIFCLPGNPVSALVTLNLFVLPSLHKLCGLGERSRSWSTKPLPPALEVGLPRVSVVLAHPFPLDPSRTEYHRAVVTASRSDARLYATSTAVDGEGRRSSRVGNLVKANALIILPPGVGVRNKGELVEALMMGAFAN